VKELFRLQEAGVSHAGKFVLSGVSLTLHAGEFLAIAGPNGAGKSTLLSLIAGLTAPAHGTCRLDGQDAHRWPRRDFAKRVAVVLQADASNFPFTAEEVISMGRSPHISGMYETAEDHAAVARAIAATETGQFRNREFRTLSGGEKQRVLLACALAQSSEILLLDEPATHLDLQHQVALHRMLRELSRQGLLVVAVTHDLNLAAAYADRLVLLHQGRVRADGAPGEVLRADLIEDVFSVPIQLLHTDSGKPWLTYGA
jgi:iron complex transport system ATP-binding protein